MIEKKLLYSLFIYTNKSKQLFHRVHKILRWIGSSDFQLEFIFWYENFINKWWRKK